jgi:hypothetical protein
MDESLIDLDTKWIEEFDSIDEKYKEFYSDDVTFINFNYMYVNKENSVEKIKKETLLLKEPNYISREEIVGILKKNCKTADRTYTVLSILKYNINIDPDEINHFISTTQKDDIFLKSLNYIDAIHLDKTISMFQDLNEIIVIFYEKMQSDHNTSKTKNLTKRIYFKTINNNKRKTYRKMV